MVTVAIHVLLFRNNISCYGARACTAYEGRARVARCQTEVAIGGEVAAEQFQAAIDGNQGCGSGANDNRSNGYLHAQILELQGAGQLHTCTSQQQHIATSCDVAFTGNFGCYT